jgi:hypothetical protein
MNRKLVFPLFLGMTLTCLGCGGGPSSSNPPPQSVTVAVSSASSTVLLGSTVQFSATVTGSSNTLVNWSVSGTGVGSINTSGLYTAPADLPKPATVTVTATSQADPTKSSTATVTITSDVAVSLSATPSGASSIAFNEALTLAATVASSGKPDTSIAWTVNGVPNGNPAVGTITTSGSTMTYTAPTTPAQVSIAATSVADPSKSASLSVNIAALSAGALSNSSPLPLTPIQISTAGLNTTAAVQIQFSNGSGFAATQNPIRVASDGTVVAAVPLYVDTGTGQIGPGTVSVVLTQGSQSTAPMPLNIQDLPPVSAYGTQLGDITRAVLNLEAMLVGRRLNELQAFQAFPGHTVDTSLAQSTLQTLLNAVIKARSDVDQVSLDNTAVISNGTLPDGTSVQFDKTSLDIMDRVNAVFLSQTLGPMILTGSASAQVPASVSVARLLQRSHRHAQPRLFAPLREWQPFRFQAFSARRIYSTVTPHAETSFNIGSLLPTMQTLGAISTISSGSTAAAAAQSIGDEIAALVGGTASLGSVLQALPTKSANLTLGAVGAIISDIHLAGNGWGMLTAYAYAVATHNQALQNVVVEEANAVDRREVYFALADLTLAFPSLAAIDALQPVSTVLNFIETGYNVDKALQNVDSTGLAIENSYQVPPVDTQGIAFVNGNVNVPTNQGIGAPLSGIELSSNGITFDTMADLNGSYQLFVPLQASPFNYASADVTIVDPISQSILGSALVDLSNLITSAPLQIPTIQGTPCSNIDFDGDDPDCD